MFGHSNTVARDQTARKYTFSVSCVNFNNLRHKYAVTGRIVMKSSENVSLLHIYEMVIGFLGEQERSPEWRVLGEALPLASGISKGRDSPFDQWVQGERSLLASD